MELNAIHPNLMPFYSIAPELDITSIQMYTLYVALNPTTSAIFCIYDEIISQRVHIEGSMWKAVWSGRKKFISTNCK